MSLERQDEGRELSLLKRFPIGTNLGRALHRIVSRKEELEQQKEGVEEALLETNDILEAVDAVFRLQDNLMAELKEGAKTVLETVARFEQRVDETRKELDELLGATERPPASP